ncbi:MAG: hypothetical protein KC684_10170, partial [Candidatus Omnitrophica bacterium]|nr:hypothetical protein [Candidatus Omnitrophota bacterium]
VMDDSTFLPAWKKFTAILKENTRHFLMFVFVSIVASIICGIMATIVFILLVVFCLLVGAFIFGVGYFIFATLLNMELLFSVFAFAVGVPFFLLFLILLFSVSLPFAVFFRSFSLYFLSSLECGYQPLPLEEGAGDNSP